MNQVVMNKAACLKVACRPFSFNTLLRGASTSSKRTSVAIFTHYEVLGVERNASTDDIREAFLKLSKECHPDMNSQTHDKFVRVNEAYSVLSKALSRKDYDLSLQARESVRYPYHTSYPSSNGQRAYRHPHDEGPGQFHDPYIYSMRDKSQDAFYEGKPYYGVKGLSKVSNTNIVLTCFGVIVAGIMLHYFAVRKTSSLHIKNLNERDVKTHKLWRDANDPALFNERLKSFRNQIQEKDGKGRGTKDEV